ncbi:hypothetical protein LZ32DRAFT_280964 [Colletotrichum eremochloae]|nr:hypothetical protein LZ32DRAFT_280964 [Colletotrichum eremochloae]
MSKPRFYIHSLTVRKDLKFYHDRGTLVTRISTKAVTVCAIFLCIITNYWFTEGIRGNIDEKFNLLGTKGLAYGPTVSRIDDPRQLRFYFSYFTLLGFQNLIIQKETTQLPVSRKAVTISSLLFAFTSVFVPVLALTEEDKTGVILCYPVCK